MAIYSINHLIEVPSIIDNTLIGKKKKRSIENLQDNKKYRRRNSPDYSDLIGQPILRRSMEICAAGMHNILLFGPPGSGKTMAVMRLPGILPDLNSEEVLEVRTIWSRAGRLPHGMDILRHRPFRTPHHSASKEGIMGGGAENLPGEASFAHRGVLFLDDTPKFGRSLLQAVGEPLKNRTISFGKAEHPFSYPADFQLVMAANPCPCGNLGKEGSVCSCSIIEIHRYWNKIGGPLLDQIDMRVPLKPVDPAYHNFLEIESSHTIKNRVMKAVASQDKRFQGEPYSRNARIPAGSVKKYCSLDDETRILFTETVRRLSLSPRACHSILKIARTIADLQGCTNIERDHFLEAVFYRRYGDRDIFWNEF
jgi:magnesium chelatase family protein